MNKTIKLLKTVHNTVNTPWYTAWWNTGCSPFLAKKKILRVSRRTALPFTHFC